ncbi:MAG: hypothetical protein ACK55Z_05450, partial [bacterium]
MPDSDPHLQVVGVYAQALQQAVELPHHLVQQSTEAAGLLGGSVFSSGGDGPPAFKTPCSAAWCGLSQSPIGQPTPLPATSQP